MSDEKPDKVFWHQSGVNPKGKPFVQLLLDEEIIAQLDPDMAREHGLAMLEAAEASEQDAFLVQWAQTELGLSFEKAGYLLMQFRVFRAANTTKKGGPTNPRDWVRPEKPDV